MLIFGNHYRSIGSGRLEYFYYKLYSRTCVFTLKFTLAMETAHTVQLAPQTGAGSVTVFKCLPKKRVFVLEH
jgi:hypothetical protein